jgi:hypothetical protein
VFIDTLRLYYPRDEEFVIRNLESSLPNRSIEIGSLVWILLARPEFLSRSKRDSTACGRYVKIGHTGRTRLSGSFLPSVVRFSRWCS